MKTGARNDIVGEVVEVRTGDMMGVAKVKIPAESVVASVMTAESLDSLGLKAGDNVRVVIKAVSVLLVKD